MLALELVYARLQLRALHRRHDIAREIDVDVGDAYDFVAREGRVQSAERAVPTPIDDAAASTTSFLSA
jgi:hypothetical protein